MARETVGTQDEREIRERIEGGYPITAEDAKVFVTLIDAERKRVAKAEQERDVYDHALHSLTAGGSEFAHDAKACVAYVKARQTSQHEILIKTAKERNELRKRVRELQQERDTYQAMYQDGLVSRKRRAEGLEERVEELEGALRVALQQWRIHAEDDPDFDNDNDITPEGRLYRKINEIYQNAALLPKEQK